MFNKILFYGAVAGLIVGVELFVVTVTMNGHISGPLGLVVGYATMLIALSAIFIAVKRHRDFELGGVIKFWPAFAMGLGISVVAGILYVLAWEVAQAVAHLDFADGYAKSVIREQVAQGVSGEALAKLEAEMEHFKVQYANPFYRLPMTFGEIFPVGVLVSLISAGLLRNSRFFPLSRSNPPNTEQRALNT